MKSISSSLVFPLSVATAVVTVFRASSAEWIAGAYEPPAESDVPAFFAPAPNDIVEKRFVARDAEVRSAKWKVAAPGMRDLFVNGARVSSTALPPWTPYGVRVIEEEFDVTPQVRRGAENAIRVELGNGWFNPLPIKMWYSFNLREALAVGTPCVRATLEISYADGSSQSVETGEDWLAAQGRVVRNSIYLGVEEDMRREVSFSGRARRVPGPKGRISSADSFPKTVVYRRWKAKSVTAVSNGVWVVDMGVNYAGTYRATLRGLPSGAKVKFRQGERIHGDGRVNVLSAVAGQIKDPSKGPLFAVAEECDSVVSAGEAEFVFEPRLTFHVLRFIQVEGLSAAPSPNDFEAQAWSADVADRSFFICSDERLNKLHEMCRRTFRANMQSVQSDCPGREKFGYGGDLACTLDAFWGNWDMLAFYRKTVRDFTDEASVDGIITETAPFVGICSSGVFPKKEFKVRGAAPMGWAVGLPVLLDSLVKYEGDFGIVAEAYPALVRYISLVTAAYPANDIPKCLGDWVPAVSAEKADTGLSALAHWYQFVRLTSKLARHIGKSDDARRYGELAARIAADFRARYVKPGGLVNNGSQGDQIFALYNGLVDPADVPAAIARIKADAAKRGNSLTTGIFGTKYLLEYLPDHGEAELAAQLVMHEGYPGWFDMLSNGATTLWEHWKYAEGENVHSNCHPMFGSVDEWLMRHVLGISVCEDAVAFNKVAIDPKPFGGITGASGWIDTPKGRISVSWRMEDGEMKIDKSVPPGISVVKMR